MSYLLHSVVKAIVIPAMYFPHYEIYFNIFNIATVIVSERDSEHKINSLSAEGLKAPAVKTDVLRFESCLYHLAL